MSPKVPSRKHNPDQLLHNSLPANSTVTPPSVTGAEEVESFTNNITALHNNTPGKSLIADPVALRNKIELAVAHICETTCAYATKYNHAVLAAEVCYTKSDLQRMKDWDILGLVIRIINALTPLLQYAGFVKYQITQQILTNLLADATTFNNSIGKNGLLGNNMEGTTANAMYNTVTRGVQATGDSSIMQPSYDWKGNYYRKVKVWIIMKLFFGKKVKLPKSYPYE